MSVGQGKNELKDKDLDRALRELEFKSRKWNSGWGRLVSFLAVLIPLVIFAWSYYSAKANEKFQFLVGILLDHEASNQDTHQELKFLVWYLA